MREIDEADLTTAPGSRFEYSNSNYEVLAAMAEAVGLTGDWIKRALDATQIELLTALLTKCVQAPVR